MESDKMRQEEPVKIFLMRDLLSCSWLPIPSPRHLILVSLFITNLHMQISKYKSHSCEKNTFAFDQILAAFHSHNFFFLIFKCFEKTRVTSTSLRPTKCPGWKSRTSLMPFLAPYVYGQNERASVCVSVFMWVLRSVKGICIYTVLSACCTCILRLAVVFVLQKSHRGEFVSVCWRLWVSRVGQERPWCGCLCPTSTHGDGDIGFHTSARLSGNLQCGCLCVYMCVCVCVCSRPVCADVALLIIVHLCVMAWEYLLQIREPAALLISDGKPQSLSIFIGMHPSFIVCVQSSASTSMCFSRVFHYENFTFFKLHYTASILSVSAYMNTLN